MELIAQSAIKEVVDESLPRKSTQESRKHAEAEAMRGFSVDTSPQKLKSKRNIDSPPRIDDTTEPPGDTIPGAGHDLSIMLDGKLITIEDQIQMYTTNQLISHPLVSPVLQPSLGGLPPLLIMTGGGEILRDEQIYLAHKAASPAKYPPGEAYLDEFPESKATITKFQATDVQLQVWDDLCHVAPALSFTRPAKYMYRSIAQFGAWALAKAQKTDIEIQDDDDMSIISSGSDSEGVDEAKKKESTKAAMNSDIAKGGAARIGQVGKAGQPLPQFKHHMIRQRVDRHGNVFGLDPPSSLAALQMSPNDIGVIKPGPVQKWLNAKKTWDKKYAKEMRRVQKQRAKEMAKGFQGFGDDEVPPPSALAGRRGLNMPKEAKKGRSWGMSLWSLWGSSHDENTIEREEKADKHAETTPFAQVDGVAAQPEDVKQTRGHSRSKSRRRTVTYTPQDDDADENTPAVQLMQKREEARQATSDPAHLALPIITANNVSSESTTPQIRSPDRPSMGGKAFPFKLGTHLTDDGRNASTITLMSQGGTLTPRGDEKNQQLGATVVGEDRRMTMEDSDGVLHKALVQEKGNHDDTDRNDGEDIRLHNADAITGEGRRMTMQDGDGILYKATAQREDVDEDVIRKGDEKGKQLGESDSQEARRMTMQDADGVHKNLMPERVISKISESDKPTERPHMERFETAKEDL